jgi:hypothetical protein
MIIKSTYVCRHGIQEFGIKGEEDTIMKIIMKFAEANNIKFSNVMSASSRLK